MYLTWFFHFFFINFVIFENPKRKIKQEVDLVLLFELFSIRKYRKWETELSNQYIFRDGPLFLWRGGGGGMKNIEKKLFAGPKKTK